MSKTGEKEKRPLANVNPASLPRDSGTVLFSLLIKLIDKGVITEEEAREVLTTGEVYPH